jgi:hypothetical protein
MLYQAAAGNEALIAGPALMAGQFNIDPNIGVIPAANLWSA